MRETRMKTSTRSSKRAGARYSIVFARITNSCSPRAVSSIPRWRWYSTRAPATRERREARGLRPVAEAADDDRRAEGEHNGADDREGDERVVGVDSGSAFPAGIPLRPGHRHEVVEGRDFRVRRGQRSEE